LLFSQFPFTPPERLPGVNALYRAKDDDGNRLLQRILNEEMAVFATPGRRFKFAFDHETNPISVINVRRDKVRAIELLEARGCHCEDVKWEQEKGLDDLIVNQGALEYTRAQLNAISPERDKKAHYRYEFNHLTKQVKREMGNIPQEQLDIEVYLRAIANGDLADGDRFLSQSDYARTLKDPEKVSAYIEQVKINAPLYRQQQQAIAVAKAQDTKDRADYEAIALKVKSVYPYASGAEKDGYIWLYAMIKGQPGDGDRILRKSDAVKGLSPESTEEYIRDIQALAPSLVPSDEPTIRRSRRL
jgi:hypothetical protein